MSTHPSSPVATARTANLFEAHLASYFDHLRAVEYAENSLHHKHAVITAFVCWARAKKLREEVLSKRDIDAFLKGLFPEPTKQARYAQTTLRLWLDYLRAEGWAPTPVTMEKSVSRTEELLRDYIQYLRTDRGLDEKSVLVYAPFVRNFLAQQASQINAVESDGFDAPAIRRFLLDHSQDRSSEYCRLQAIALRSLCRFLFLRGETPLDLSKAIPSVRRWRQADIPVFLMPEEVERILATPDLAKSCGRRDHAVLLLLARLGLRAGEIVALELGDLHWRTGEIVIHGKGRIQQCLPLPSDVGEALVLYLQQDRRCSTSRRVFLREKAPCGGFTGPSAIGHIVRLALARAEIRPASRGAAHLLRHSLATRMIRHGASLAQIAEVLRHRSENSSVIYAKVSLEALREVARPWPAAGDAS